MPKEYYLLSPYEFECIMSGYADKQKKEAMLFRNVAYQIYGLAGGKKTINQFWKIDDRTETLEIEVTENDIERIKIVHGIK